MSWYELTLAVLAPAAAVLEAAAVGVADNAAGDVTAAGATYAL